MQIISILALKPVYVGLNTRRVIVILWRLAQHSGLTFSSKTKFRLKNLIVIPVLEDVLVSLLSYDKKEPDLRILHA